LAKKEEFAAVQSVWGTWFRKRGENFSFGGGGHVLRRRVDERSFDDPGNWQNL
jgi:hypothetical protein